MWKTIPKGVTHIAGIDEAGRGPLAGPVTVGLVVVPVDFDTDLLVGVRDSKDMPQHKREDWYKRADQWHEDGVLYRNVTHTTHKTIDTHGITRAVARGIRRALKDVDHRNTMVLLDGLLRAPRRFKYQETIVKGDQKVPLISLASNIAKVSRDAKMRRYAGKYKNYGFNHHKGYGTKQHRDCIKEFGLCAIHRRKYCEGLT